MGIYCGDSIPPNHVSSSNEVLIHFYSNIHTTEAGFQMEYNPTGKQNTFQNTFQNNTKYYVDIKFWGHSSRRFSCLCRKVEFQKFLRRIFMMNVCDECLWQIFVTNVCDEYLWRIFVTNVCEKCLWQMFVTNVWDEF